MKDRIARNPNRVLVTPENGGAAYYATLTRADNPEQEGTPINKRTLLPDDVAEIFGLDADAVPVDVFSFLGKYNTHLWRRVTNGYAEVRVPVTSATETMITNQTVTSFQYSSKISISSNGVVSLVSPSTMSPSLAMSSSTDKIAALAPCYIYSSLLGSVYYLPKGATSVYYDSSSTVWMDTNYTCFRFGLPSKESIRACKVMAQTSYGKEEFVFSENRNEYPDSGTSNGYEYEYKGVPFESILKAAKIATGSYNGTGTLGQSNPNSLTFNFVPKLLFIGSAATNTGIAFLTATGGGLACYGGTTVKLVSSVNGNTISWYSTVSQSSGGYEYQMNKSGTTYVYTAIG